MRIPLRLIGLLTAALVTTSCANTIPGTPRAAQPVGDTSGLPTKLPRDSPSATPSKPSTPSTRGRVKAVRSGCAVIPTRRLAKDFAVASLRAEEGKSDSLEGSRLYSCIYTGSGRRIVVFAGKFDDQPSISPQEQLRSFIKSSGGSNAHPVSGIGTGAISYDIVKAGKKVRGVTTVVDEGDTVFIVALLTSPHSGMDTHLTNAARHAIS